LQAFCRAPAFLQLFNNYFAYSVGLLFQEKQLAYTNAKVFFLLFAKLTSPVMLLDASMYLIDTEPFLL